MINDLVVSFMRFGIKGGRITVSEDSYLQLVADAKAKGCRFPTTDSRSTDFRLPEDGGFDPVFSICDVMIEKEAK